LGGSGPEDTPESKRNNAHDQIISSLLLLQLHPHTYVD
jgi:hypothetical protein